MMPDVLPCAKIKMAVQLVALLWLQLQGLESVWSCLSLLYAFFAIQGKTAICTNSRNLKDITTEYPQAQ